MDHLIFSLIIFLLIKQSLSHLRHTLDWGFHVMRDAYLRMFDQLSPSYFLITANLFLSEADQGGQVHHRKQHALLLSEQECLPLKRHIVGLWVHL